MPTRPHIEVTGAIDPDSTVYRSLRDEYAAERALAAQVGTQLKAARKTAGLTQAQLAKASGVDRADISQMERGLLNPTVKRLQRLAAVLNVTVKIELAQALPQESTSGNEPGLPLAM